MRVPKTLEGLVEQGIIEEVIRPLMSGKEAQLYMVVCRGQICAAKVYKDADNRSFKNRSDYMDGRKVRNTRDQRAMSKGSAYGRTKEEEAWRTTEVDMIYRLHAAGVRVPTPHTFIDGVLVMELVTDADGNPAPRLGDLDFTHDQAINVYHHLMREVVRMLCAGVVHGDLSDFNVLLGADGPVVIDFPQSVNAASNQNARTLLLRDVANLQRFVRRFAPELGPRRYGEEIWQLYENNQLTPETELMGRHQAPTASVDTRAVLELIGDANHEEDQRRRRRGAAPLDVAAAAAPVANSRLRIIEIQPNRASRSGGGRGGYAKNSGGGGAPRAAAGAGQASRRPATDGNRKGGYPPVGTRDEPRYGSGNASGRKPKAKPKRGDGAQTPTYVSPAARHSSFRLTPREDPDRPPSNTDTRLQPAAGREQEAKPRRRRRSRGARGEGAQAARRADPQPSERKAARSEPAPAVKPQRNASAAPEAGPSDAPRRRRRRRRTGSA